jgi:hypothetical protein
MGVHGARRHGWHADASHLVAESLGLERSTLAGALALFLAQTVDKVAGKAAGSLVTGGGPRASANLGSQRGSIGILDLGTIIEPKRAVGDAVAALEADLAEGVADVVGT